MKQLRLMLRMVLVTGVMVVFGTTYFKDSQRASIRE